MLPIVFAWFLSFGYMPQLTENMTAANYAASGKTNIVALNSDYATYATIYTTEIGLSATYRRMTIGGSVLTYEYCKFPQRLTFMPFRADYSIYVQLELTKHLMLEARHECDHTVEYATWPWNPGEAYGNAHTTVRLTLHGDNR